MKILAFDTCFGVCSVAIIIDGVLNSYILEEQQSQQAEKLLPMIEGLLENAGLVYSDIDYLAVTIGPGGFTGVRIGLSTAYGICIATNIPLITLSTLETVAWKAQQDLRSPIIVALHASLEKFYCQAFFHDIVKSVELATRREESKCSKTYMSDEQQSGQFKSLNYNTHLTQDLETPTIVSLDLLNRLDADYTIVGNYCLHNANQGKLILPDAKDIASLAYIKVIKNDIKLCMVDFANPKNIRFIEPIYLRSFT